jgi:hypothetical protein
LLILDFSNAPPSLDANNEAKVVPAQEREPLLTEFHGSDGRSSGWSGSESRALRDCRLWHSLRVRERTGGNTLTKTPEEEKETDEKLTQLAEKINPQANEATGHDQHEMSGGRIKPKRVA